MASYLTHDVFEAAVLSFHQWLKRQDPAVAADLLAALGDPEPGPEASAIIGQFEQMHPSQPVSWLAAKK